MLRHLMLNKLKLALLALLSVSSAHGSSYIVANGDDGSDLEGGKLITSGILIETRNKAIERMKRLNTPSIDHLGTLIPELEKSDIFLVERNLKPKLKNDLGLETNGTEVFARTFAEPHAATRFFPAALSLNEEQLIALHVHEALHRTLPSSVRENEAIVTRITLALTASDTSLDRARRVITAEVGGNADTSASNAAANGRPSGELRSTTKATLGEKTVRSSTVTYSFQSFSLVRDSSQYPIDSLHNLRMIFYPLGSQLRNLGLGMEFSYLKSPNQAYIMRPLTLLGQLNLGQFNDYEITGFASISLNTMSNSADSEFATSPIGRDFTTIGARFRRDETHYYVEDKLSLAFVDEAKRRLSTGTETYHSGKVIAASVHAGAKYSSFELGGFAELLLSDSFKTVEGRNSRETAGRFRVLGAGPEMSYLRGPMRFSLAGRWVLDATPGMSVDDIGDLIGYGVGQASVSASASLRF